MENLRARVSELKSLFRHLQEYRSLREHHGVDEITSPSGVAWSLWDLEYLLIQSQQHLSFRQAQAIQLCLIDGLSEREASIRMGISPTNPVAIYASQGLTRLLKLMDAGLLPRFLPDSGRMTEIHHDQRRQALERAAKKILAEVRIDEPSCCWIYPLSDPRVEPVVRIRSSTAPSGHILVHPRVLVYEATVDRVPAGYGLDHRSAAYYFRGCTNPEHAVTCRRGAH